jgi:hypothetical protein
MDRSLRGKGKRHLMKKAVDRGRRRGFEEDGRQGLAKKSKGEKRMGGRY